MIGLLYREKGCIAQAAYLIENTEGTAIAKPAKNEKEIEYPSYQWLGNLLTDTFASRLGWLWDSWREPEQGNSPEPPHKLPDVLPLTKRSNSTASLLQADLAEINVDGYARNLYIYGVSPDYVDALLNPETFNQAVLNFAIQEQGPIEVIMWREAEEKHLTFYLPHIPSEAIMQLLASWGTPPIMKAPRWRLPWGGYKPDRMPALEALPRFKLLFSETTKEQF